MNRKRKLLSKVLTRPAQVRFNDACKVAELLGFVMKGGAGSHCTFAKADEPMLMNFQNRHGYIPNYQVRQLALMINKYGEDDETLPH